MDEEKDFLAEARALEAEAALAREEARAAAEEPAAQREWIRQSNLIYGGLGAAGLVVVQPFLTVESLDASAMVCVVAFAVSLPLLAALLMLNWQEEFRRRVSKSGLVEVAKSLAQGSAFVGVAAAFWHISMVAGIVFLAMGIVALAVHSSGYTALEYDSKFRSRFRSRKTPESTPPPDSQAQNTSNTNNQ
ncbi:hypothetical protein AB0H36_19485 [Kribbella sp. NPDC050820]|uniref:hypothetical protein n=1 Tax=Kribbella sp. NPDC050820 TaxID=3155408 RepID=UPI0033C4F791